LRGVLNVGAGAVQRFSNGHGCRNTDGKAGDTFHGGACFYLLFLLFLRHRFRHQFRHGVFSFTEKVF
jgi:hypothetical protein